MGLFNIFKKRELTEEEKNFSQGLKSFHHDLKIRHNCHEAWESVDLNNNDILLSLVGFKNLKDLAITLSPKSISLIISENSNDILVDVSKEGEVPWEEIKKHISGSFDYFENNISVKDIILEADDKNSVPRIVKHPAGVTGFWMTLPLSLDVDLASSVKNFDGVIEWCIQTAEKL